MKYYLEEQRSRQQYQREHGELFEMNGEWYQVDIYEDAGYRKVYDRWMIELQGACPFCGNHHGDADEDCPSSFSYRER